MFINDKCHSHSDSSSCPHLLLCISPASLSAIVSFGDSDVASGPKQQLF